jgi:NADPH:quinone reductase-like Zn-dependent oxidoreductase
MSHKTMQAVRFHQYGGPEVLVNEQVPVPHPQPGQVLVRLVAAGVNPADWQMRAGYYQKFMPLPLPWTPGVDGAGIIEAVGENVKTFQPGQAVYGLFTGGYAEYALANANEIHLKPAHLTFEQAATVAHGALAAWQAVVEEAEARPGQTILVHGGAGGVGLYAVQFAKWKGARVIATTSAANVDFVHSLGAHQVIDYQTTNFEDVVKEVDAVIDTVGGDLIARSLKVIRNGGKYITMVGQVDPEAGAARDILVSMSRRADPSKLEQIAQLLESKKVVPVVGKIFPLSQARQAQELSQTGHGRGRIILLTL